jgi:hypothetical protein
VLLVEQPHPAAAAEAQWSVHHTRLAGCVGLQVLKTCVQGAGWNKKPEETGTKLGWTQHVQLACAQDGRQQHQKQTGALTGIK